MITPVGKRRPRSFTGGMEQNGISGMAKGDGDGSYVKNSYWQDATTMSYFSLLSDVLEKLRLPAPEKGPLIVADLGCSSGPNTINLVTGIVETLRDRYASSGRELPEFQGIFSDLPGNDFNVLFQLITSASRNFLVSGVPGSCYGRLLPRSSVQVFTTTHTLHWLSKVPAAVLDPRSPAYNGDRVWLDGCSAETLNAYRQQALADLRTFLSARAEELSPGGVLFCFFIAAGGSTSYITEEDLLRPLSEDAAAPGPLTLWRMMEHVFEQMVSEGILSREQKTSLNLPFCSLTEEEIRDVLADYTEVFHVEKFVTSSSPLSEKQQLDLRQTSPATMVRFLMAVVGPFLKDKLRENLVTTFTERLTSFMSKENEKGFLVYDFVNHMMILSRK